MKILFSYLHKKLFYLDLQIFIYFYLISKKKLCFLFKPNTEEYCRNSRLSTVEGHDTAAGPDSVKFHGINNTDFEIGELNLIDMEPDEIRVI